MTLESTGVSSAAEHRTWIGKALALSCLRQDVFRAYRQLIPASGANSEDSGRHLRRAKELRTRAGRLLSIPDHVPDVAGLRKCGMRAAALSVLHERLAVLKAQEERRRQTLLASLAVAAHDSQYANGTITRLDDFTGWAQLLRGYADPPQASSEQDLALAELASLTTPRNRALLRTVGVYAARPAVAAERLEVQAQWMENNIAALYTCRNLHLHSGIQDLAGGVTLGTLGPRIVDSLFEMWAAWYGPGGNLDPIEIIREIASRFDLCTNNLGTTSRLEELDLRSITGLSWSPGSRRNGQDSESRPVKLSVSES